MITTVSLQKKYFICCIIAVAFLFFTILLPLCRSDTLPSPSNQTPSTDQKTNNTTTLTETNTPYTTLLKKTTNKRYTTTINGTQTTIVELPSNSTIIQLPNDQLGIEYSETERTILPQGSSITQHDNAVFVNLPETQEILKAENLITVPVATITSSAVFSQKIKKLDTYTITVTLPSFSSPVFSENIKTYTINWGDGTIQTYTPQDVSIQHSYTKNGAYTVSFQITDTFGFTYELEKNYTIDYEGDVLHGYYVLEANKEPVAVTTSTSLGLITLGFIALTETGKYKFLALLLLALPLYTRIQKEDVLDQFVRGQIYGFIKTNPGAHYNQIRRKIDVKNGTLSYHLWVLEKTELIKSRREGLRYRAFYPTAMKFPKDERFRLTELQIKILDLIKQNPGVHQKEIARNLGEKPQTINYNIKVLSQAELIQVTKKGRMTRIYSKKTTQTTPDTQNPLT